MSGWKKLPFLALMFVWLIPAAAFAESGELVVDTTTISRAQVVEILKQESRTIPGTETSAIYQTITARFLDETRAGETITLENDFLVLRAGEKFFLQCTRDGLDGRELCAVRDVDRRGVLLVFVVLFGAVIVIFSGWQGLRSLASLAGSLLVILYVLVPGLLSGYPPVLTSTAIATVILFLAIYFTHGFNRESTAAFAGTALAVILTGALAYWGVVLAHLSGFASEEAIYLNFNTRGSLDFSGLLLSGIIIGVLGVLDDIAITQAVVARELARSAPHLSRRAIYKQALRVGREHVGALVNTLALAYTGASLPLLLLFSTSEASVSSIINQEIFATEILRTVAGSIGLVLAVPLTTLIAVWLLIRPDRAKISPDVLAREQNALKQFEHKH